jgi:hypothetical protein
VQHDILERHPAARLRVYALWTNKLFFDSRDRWDAAGLADPRVTHLWDGPDVVGRWLVEHAPGFDGGDWDAYALFGPEARWTAASPPAPVSSGSTVVANRDRLARAILPLLAGGG